MLVFAIDVPGTIPSANDRLFNRNRVCVAKQFFWEVHKTPVFFNIYN